ncbi:MAG: hypothetical protein AAF721_00785 [Myxococcota bacterium]
MRTYHLWGAALLAGGFAVSCAPRSTTTPDRTGGDCYPYLPRANGSCPTRCRSIDDCAGSRGPADFAENGWPLDCIGSRCVPLPPEAVQDQLPEPQPDPAHG